MWRALRDRPLASGALHPREALIVTGALAALALGLAVLVLNRLTIALALAAGLLAATYPFMKRLHSWPQAHLGVAFAWSVPMAFTAITDTWPPSLAWLLFAAVIVWTVAYDTLYAMADREDDLKLGIKSTAILFASADRLAVGVLQGLVIVMLAGVGVLGGLGPGYYVALALGCGAVRLPAGAHPRAGARALPAGLSEQPVFRPGGVPRDRLALRVVAGLSGH